MSRASDDRVSWGSTVTVEPSRSADDPHGDVELARDRVRNARPSYGPRTRPKAPTGGDRVRSFVRRYGWRAYALPILVVLTVAALMTTATSSSQPPAADAPAAAGPQREAPPVAGAHIPLKNDDQGKISDTVLRAAALPSGPAYTTSASGTFRVLPGTTRKVGSGQLFRYSVDVENGVTGVDLTQFASMVDQTMDDPRSWSGHGVAVQRVDSGRADFRVSLTAAMTVRKICGYDIQVETSCYARSGTAGLDDNRVIFNVARWMRGAPAYLGDLDAYRTYMINHENGHALGHNHAHSCLPGGLAPVMMQQTFGLRETRGGDSLCSANPWPYPVGAKGAPGAEQADTAQNNEYGRGD